MARAQRFPGRLPLVLAALTLAASGCRLAPRDELDDCHRLSQTLRSENARLKDRTLALQSQNQDYSERAVDDSRRLAQLEAVNQRLETSVQAYQDERTRLETAYKQLRASLPGSLQPLTIKRNEGDDQAPDAVVNPVPFPDPGLRKTEGSTSARSGRLSTGGRDAGGWVAARSEQVPELPSNPSSPLGVP
jgi:hypothetical protein